MRNKDVVDSSKSKKKKVIISLCAVVLVLGIAGITGFSLTRNKVEEEVLSSDALKQVSENSNDNITNNKDANTNNEIKNEENNDAQNDNTNNELNENIQIQDNYVANNNVVNNINNNNNTQNANVPNNQFVQKVTEDVTVEKEYTENEKNWEIEEVKLTGKPDVKTEVSDADTTLPVITVKGDEEPAQKYVGNLDKKVFSKVSFKLYDNYGIYGYKLNDEEYTKVSLNNWSDANFDNIKSRLNYGKNTITLKDVAGNETTYEFTYDNVAPVYKTLGIARNKDKDDTRDQAYAKTGDSIRVLISFAEKLGTEPKVTINGKDYECTYREKSSNEENNTYYYMADITITDEMNLPEGEIAFNVYGYAGEAGNVGEELNNSKINMSAYPKVIYDKTAPSIKTLGILNLDHFKAGNPNYAKADATIRVYASFSEKLAENPVVKIAGKDYTFRLDRENNGTYIYMMDKKISEIEGLEEGIINFEISGYKDLAGNVGETLTQDNTNYKGFESVTYDNTSASVFSSDFYAEGVTPIDQISYVNNGKTIVINAKFNEMLGNTPKIVLKDSVGKEYTLTSEYTGIDNKNDGKGDRYTYTAKFVTTEEVAQGELTYTISEIYDQAGNKTEDITKATNGRRVIFDNVAPEHTAINLIGSKYSKEDKAWFVKNDDHVAVYVRFNEEIKNEPVLKIEGIDNEIKLDRSIDKNGVKYGKRFQITDEFKSLKDGEMKIEISGYEDLAGNAGKILYNEDIKGLDSQSKVIIDRTAPVISINKDVIIECGSEFVEDIDDRISDNLTQAKDLKVEIYPVDGIEVDTNKVGTYQINYKISDKAGNYAVETRTINVVDKAAPEIIFPDNVIGLNNNELYFDAGCEFTLDGLVSVKDNVDPNPELRITGITYYGGPEAKDNIYGKTEEFLTKGLDTKLTGKANNCGRYNIDYEATDASGNKSTRTLLVMFIDKVAPTISIDPSSIGKDGYYSKMVVNANDNAYLAYFEINGAKSTITDDDAIAGVSDKGRTFLNDTINGHIKFGETNTIVAYDRAGNKSNVIEFIADREKPVISIDRNVTLKVGETFTEDIYEKISDNVNVNKDLKVGFWPVNDHPLDTNTPGEYKINYKVEDKAGNYEVATRIITVVASEQEDVQQ